MTTAIPIQEHHVQFYRDNGFVQVDNMLSPDELEELREYLEEAMRTEGDKSGRTDKKGGSYYRVLNQKVNTWRDHGGMALFSFRKRFAESARALIGSKEVRFFHDHALWKMPGDSKPTPWHQDTPFWPVDGNYAEMISIWIALDDVDESNGCMAFIPKSNRLGKLTGIDLATPQNIFNYVEGGQLDNSKPVVVPMKAGSCTFHNGLTFHYAHANSTDRPRRALAIIYMPEGVAYNGAGHLVTDGSGLQAGDPLRGPLFPLLAKGE